MADLNLMVPYILPLTNDLTTPQKVTAPYIHFTFHTKQILTEKRNTIDYLPNREEQQRAKDQFWGLLLFFIEHLYFI